MSGMDDLVTWLRGRLDERERQLAEDERVALAAADGDSGSWFVGDRWNVFRAEDRSPGEEYAEHLCVVHGNLKPQCEHIARHDPARVLAEVERGRRDIAGKRALVDVILEYEAKIDGEWGCCHSAEGIAAGRCEETRPDEIPGLRLLAQEFDGEPGWREEWRM